MENSQTTPAPAAEESAQIQQLLSSARNEQNLTLAIVAGLASMLLAAVIWAAITVSTGYQIGYIALAVGAVVGFAVRFAGRGVDAVFGYVGGLFALLGCVVGNLFSVVGFIAQEEGLGYIDALSMLNVELIVMLFKETFAPMDLVFYAIAAAMGYKFAFRTFTEADLGTPDQ